MSRSSVHRGVDPVEPFSVPFQLQLVADRHDQLADQLSALGRRRRRRVRADVVARRPVAPSPDPAA